MHEGIVRSGEGLRELRQSAWKRPSLFVSREASLNFVTALVEFDLQLRISRPPRASHGQEARVINGLCFPAWAAGLGRLRPQCPTPKGGELGVPTPEAERRSRGLARWELPTALAIYRLSDFHRVTLPGSQ